MATKIGQQIAKAFVEGKTKFNGNTQTDGRVLTLYNHAIAARHTLGNAQPDVLAMYDRAPEVKDVEITIAGYATQTTLDRLNAVIDALRERGELPSNYVGVNIHKGQLYLNHKPWHGTWTALKDRVEGDAVTNKIDFGNDLDVLTDDGLRDLLATRAKELSDLREQVRTIGLALSLRGQKPRTRKELP